MDLKKKKSEIKAIYLSKLSYSRKNCGDGQNNLICLLGPEVTRLWNQAVPECKKIGVSKNNMERGKCFSLFSESLTVIWILNSYFRCLYPQWYSYIQI